MITESKNIIILIIGLIGLIIYTIIKNIKKDRKFDEEYNRILSDKRYKIKGQYN